MVKNRPQLGKEVREGVLRGHFRTGKTFLPPLMALPGFTASDWVTADLPDLFWPLLLVAKFGDRGAFVMSQAQQAVVAAVGRDALAESGEDFDGRLTSLERISGHRSVIASSLYAHPLADEIFDSSVLGIARQYGEALPGLWLFEGRLKRAETISDEDALNALALAIVDVVGDRHLNALVKAAPFGWELMMNRVKLPSSLCDQLIGYPMIKRNVATADAFILSTFLATKFQAREKVKVAQVAWARSFWNSNWQLTECLPEELLGEADDDWGDAAPHESQAFNVEPDSGPMAMADSSDADASRSSPLTRALDIYDGFLGAVVSADAPIDIHAPARFEVLTGLVARGFRSVVAILTAPHLWSGEQAAPVMRSLLEARIVATWLLAQEDPKWFEQYQAYGHGKRKLHREIVGEFLDEFDDDPPSELVDHAEALDRRLGGEPGSMFQEVSVESTFAGKNLRTMASEVGLMDEYRFTFQIESGVTHGEWWAIEEYAMQRCMNPLHRFHLLPTFRPAYPPTAQFPVALLSTYVALVEVAQDGLIGSGGGA